MEQVPGLITETTPVAYRFEYLDGLKGTILLMEGLVMDFTFAARLKGGEVISTQMFLPPREVCNFFNPQCNHVEQMFLTGKARLPGGTHPADHRTDGGRRRVRLAGAEAPGDAALEHPLPTDSRVHFLEELMLSRRTFLEIAAASGLAAHLGCSGKPPAKKRKKLAIIASIWSYLSHAQHFGDRFLVGYPRKGQWHHPEMDVVSLYVDQKPEGDQSQARADQFGFQVYPTVQEALRCGEDKLAVDAVLLIIEHGDYPRNAKGQVLYPRYELFQQVVEVFEQDGRAVPVFNDKHLSY